MGSPPFLFLDFLCSVHRVFVSGTDTDIGKTVIAAIITRALKADYWKPVQCGNLDESDSIRVANLLQPWKDEHKIWPEGYKLKEPASPHYAAELESIELDPNQLRIPSTERNLVIEGAGGWMVPLNNDQLIADWVTDMEIPVVLVSFNRLGSINHSLLSIEAVMARNLPILGIVFNGPHTPSSEDYILQYSGLPCLGRVPMMDEVGSEQIDFYASQIREQLEQQL
jgi:dethiobiotin synthetase